MKNSLLILCLFIVLLSSCDKGDTPENRVESKFLLKRITYSFWGSGFYYNDFQYNQKNQLVKVVADTIGKPGVVNVEYFYSADGKLEYSKHYGNIYGPGELNEVRRYAFNSSGQLIKDSAFDKNMAYMWYGIQTYTYDNTGRLMQNDNTAGGGYRFEYSGSSFNPLRIFMKGTFTASEGPANEFIEYDNKKSWFGDCITTRTYFSDKGGLPYSYANNVLFWKEPDYITRGGTMVYRKINQVFEYNADGLPQKCTIQETHYDDADTLVRGRFTLEYQKL
jgi:hypothetical protein